MEKRLLDNLETRRERWTLLVVFKFLVVEKQKGKKQTSSLRYRGTKDTCQRPKGALYSTARFLTEEENIPVDIPCSTEQVLRHLGSAGTPLNMGLEHVMGQVVDHRPSEVPCEKNILQHYVTAS